MDSPTKVRDRDLAIRLSAAALSRWPMNGKEFWVETGALIAAILLIPAYMGFIEVAPAGAVAYAGVGGVAMAAGEELQFAWAAPKLTVWDVALWTGAIAGVGGLAYLLALWLI
jgi:hypothetical protein